jgi:hypothetical protein
MLDFAAPAAAWSARTGDRDHERSDLAALAVNERQDRHHVASVVVVYAEFAAGEGFIDFDDTSVATEWRDIASSHCLANTVSQKPRGLIGHLKRAVELVGRYTFLAASHQVNAPGASSCAARSP